MLQGVITDESVLQLAPKDQLESPSDFGFSQMRYFYD